MLGRDHFHIEINYDEKGVFVTVFHLPTNQQRSARSKQGESCLKIQERLQLELIGTFLNMNDFFFQVGRCEVDGKIGGFYRVVHLPSNRSKTLNTITSPHLKNHQTILEALLEELWRDGVLPLKPGA